MCPRDMGEKAPFKARRMVVPGEDREDTAVVKSAAGSGTLALGVRGCLYRGRRRLGRGGIERQQFFAQRLR